MPAPFPMMKFAIRQVNTAKYLPARKGRGFSHDEPQTNGGPNGPRLFDTKHAARMAIIAWQKGKYEQIEGSSRTRVEYISGRATTPLEIVTLKLREA